MTFIEAAAHWLKTDTKTLLDFLHGSIDKCRRFIRSSYKAAHHQQCNVCTHCGESLSLDGPTKMAITTPCCSKSVHPTCLADYNLQCTLCTTPLHVLPCMVCRAPIVLPWDMILPRSTWRVCLTEHLATLQTVTLNVGMH